MSAQVKAIYRNGVLKPLSELNLPEEKTVEILILEDDLPGELIAAVAEKSGSYRFLEDAEEDIYTLKDGEEIERTKLVRHLGRVAPAIQPELDKRLRIALGIKAD